MVGLICLSKCLLERPLSCKLIGPSRLSSVCNGCIAAKRWEVGFKLLLVTIGSRILPFRWHENHWPLMTFIDDLKGSLRIYALLWLNLTCMGSVIVPLDKAVATSYRLSVVDLIVFPSAAVWPKFSMQGFKFILLVTFLQKRWGIKQGWCY